MAVNLLRPNASRVLSDRRLFFSSFVRLSKAILASNPSSRVGGGSRVVPHHWNQESSRHLAPSPRSACWNTCKNRTGQIHYDRHDQYQRNNVLPQGRLAGQWHIRSCFHGASVINSSPSTPDGGRELGERVSFRNLGIADALITSLDHQHIDTPTSIQEEGIPAIMRGHNVIIAAETGSGKTLTYGLPMIAALLSLPPPSLASPQPSSTGADSDSNDDSGGDGDTNRGSGGVAAAAISRPSSLVLVPHRELSHQIVKVLRSLHQPSISVMPLVGSEILINASRGGIGSAQGDGNDNDVGVRDTHLIVVGTPKCVRTNITSGYLSLEHLKCLVLDEADLLVSGSFVQDTDVVLRLAKAATSPLKGQAGQPVAVSAGEPLTTATTTESEEEEVEKPLTKPGRDSVAPNWGKRRRTGTGTDESALQRIAVVATLPRVGKTSLTDVLAKRVPKAIVVRTAGFHKHTGKLGQTFVECKSNEQRNFIVTRELGRLLAGGAAVAGKSDGVAGRRGVNVEGNAFGGKYTESDVGKSGGGNDSEETWTTDVQDGGDGGGSDDNVDPDSGILVFANTRRGVENAVAAMASANINALSIHKDLSAEERQCVLDDFNRGVGRVLVCTDIVSRGIDFSGRVNHVIQYEMALSAVSHLHRVGRTARAGRRGHAFNVYSPQQVDLVDTIRGGKSVEDAFSRRRSFRQHIQRRNEQNEFERW